MLAASELNSVVLFFGGGGFCSNVPEFATHFGAVVFMLMRCHAVAACTASAVRAVDSLTLLIKSNKQKGSAEPIQNRKPFREALDY